MPNYRGTVHPVAHHKYKYDTKRKHDKQEVEVDGKTYIISIPSGNEFRAMEKSQKDFKKVYDYLKENYKTRGDGTMIFDKEEGHIFEPHIRAIRKGFTETGLGWGKNCKFWYDNLFLEKSPAAYEKQMYIAISPAEGSTVRAPKQSKKRTREEGTVAVDDKEEESKEEVVEKISAKESEKEEEEDEGGETIYHGKKVLFGPFEKDRGTYTLYSVDGSPIGDYHPENNERPDSEEAKTKYNDHDHFVIQFFGYDTEDDEMMKDSHGVREYSSEEEGEQEIPIEWGMAMSKTYGKPYWYDKNNPSNRTWNEPPEVKKEREEIEKFEREYQEEKKRKGEEEAKRVAETARREEQQKNSRKEQRDKFRERLKKQRRMKEESKKGGRRKPKKTLKKKVSKRKSTRKSVTKKRSSKKKKSTIKKKRGGVRPDSPRSDTSSDGPNQNRTMPQLVLRPSRVLYAPPLVRNLNGIREMPTFYIQTAMQSLSNPQVVWQLNHEGRLDEIMDLVLEDLRTFFVNREGRTSEREAIRGFLNELEVSAEVLEEVDVDLVGRYEDFIEQIHQLAGYNN